MSSRTAAPRMICASRVCVTPRSFSTRAVMPTLVAESAAPTKTWARALTEMPTINSPRTAGCRKRSAARPPALAAPTRSARAKSVGPKREWPSAAAAAPAIAGAARTSPVTAASLTW